MTRPRKADIDAWREQLAADAEAGHETGDRPRTLLAPTDEAFEALPDGALDVLRDDPDTLTYVLDEHILLSMLPAEK